MLVPLKVSAPAATVTPPEPLIPPEKVVEALVRVRVSPPRATTPEPDRVMIDAPALVPEMSKTPLTSTSEESAIEPVPVNAKPAPDATSVWPV